MYVCIYSNHNHDDANNSKYASSVRQVQELLRQELLRLLLLLIISLLLLILLLTLLLILLLLLPLDK